MPEETEDFEIEIEDNPNELDVENSTKEDKKGNKKKSEVEIEVEDDTPVEDRDKTPMPKEIVDELENDELEEYSDKVKQRLKQMKKVWHDERREKEAAKREHTEAIALTKRLLEENKSLKQKYQQGEKSYVETFKQAAEMEAENAKRRYKEAYDSGNTDDLLAAQEALNTANYKLNRVKDYTPTLQNEDNGVQDSSETQKSSQITVPEPDEKTKTWQKRNTWFGSDMEMTSLAMGYHQQLAQEFGPQYLNTDEYWEKIDKRMRLRFPDYFDDGDDKKEDATESTAGGGGKPTKKADNTPVNNVAPASRSTAPRKIRLNKTQLSLAKKLGITPEQYAMEQAKLQKEN